MWMTGRWRHYSAHRLKFFYVIPTRKNVRVLIYRKFLSQFTVFGVCGAVSARSAADVSGDE